MNKYRFFNSYITAVEVETHVQKDFQENHVEYVLSAPDPFIWMIGRRWDHAQIYLTRRGYTIESIPQGAASDISPSNPTPGDTGRG